MLENRDSWREAAKCNYANWTGLESYFERWIRRLSVEIFFSCERAKSGRMRWHGVKFLLFSNAVFSFLKFTRRAESVYQANLVDHQIKPHAISSRITSHHVLDRCEWKWKSHVSYAKYLFAYRISPAGILRHDLRPCLRWHIACSGQLNRRLTEIHSQNAFMCGREMCNEYDRESTIIGDRRVPWPFRLICLIEFKYFWTWLE